MPAPGRSQMTAGNYILSNRQIAWLLLAGTIIRGMFGWLTRSWMEAPDQLAWQLSIDAMHGSGQWDYRFLVHAPHEGGTIVLGFLSLLFRPLPFLPPLSWSALLFDTGVRFVQISTTKKIFGDTIAAWFGIWTLLAVPVMIPWGTVNFGLHALSSLFPFLLLYTMHRYKDHIHLPFLAGIVCAAAVSFSYDSLVLIPVCLLFFLVVPGKNKIQAIAVFLAVFAIAMLPHTWMRAGMYPYGNNDLLLSVRSVAWQDMLPAHHWIRVLTIWFTTLPGSLIVSSAHVLPPLAELGIVCVFLFSGLALFIFYRKIKPIHWMSIAIVFFFVTVYAVSPFYGGRYDSDSYRYYRHLCYIIPLLAVVCMAGYMNSGAGKSYLLPAWITVCGLLSIQFMLTAKRSIQPAYRPAGWILMKKYAGNNDLLLHMHAVAGDQYKNELMTGYGWGLSALSLAGKNDTVPVKELVRLIRQYPGMYRGQLINGVHYSFAPGITPTLDPKLLGVFDHYIQQEMIR